MSKRHETANGNTGYPSCFRIGFTCFCDVSVYGFLEFRPVRLDTYKYAAGIPPSVWWNTINSMQEYRGIRGIQENVETELIF